MASWAYLFDRRGNLLDEFDGVFQKSKGINSVGECRFTLAVSNPKNIKSNLRFKNWIVVFNDNGLDNWVGRLDTPRSWGGGTNKHFAYSAEGIFSDRIGSYTIPYGILNTAGVCIKQIIKIANEDDDTLIRAGNIFTGGTRCGTFISPATLLMENIAQIVKQSGHEWEIVPQIVNNKLRLYLNWYERQGTVVDGSLNDRNCKIDEDSLSETGPIKNAILGVGNNQEIRTHFLARSRSSIEEYGLQATRIDVDAGEAAGVQALTQQQLARLAWPRNMFKATATNVDNTYQRLRLGNVLPFENSNAGYGANGMIGTQNRVRIWGMADSGTVEGVALSILEENQNGS